MVKRLEGENLTLKECEPSVKYVRSLGILRICCGKKYPLKTKREKRYLELLREFIFVGRVVRGCLKVSYYILVN
jgi:hypothetical protein